MLGVEQAETPAALIVGRTCGPGSDAARADGGAADVVLREVEGFAEGTAKSLLDYVGKRVLTRLADLVVPGSGVAIDLLDHVWEAARAVEAIVKGSGEVGIAVGQVDGFDVVVDFRVGGLDGSGLPVTAKLAPAGDSLFDDVEIAPEDEHGEDAEDAVLLHRDHVVMVEADLSQLMLWQPGERSAAVRRRAGQRLVPQVRSTYGDDVELLGVYDSETGAAALMRLSGSETSWCLLFWWSPGRV